MEYFVQGPDSYFLINFSLSTNYEITRFIFFVFNSTGQAINSLCTGAPPAVYQFSNLCKYFRISS